MSLTLRHAALYAPAATVGGVVLAATIPLPQAQLTGQVPNPGALAATAPLPIAALPAAVTTSVTMSVQIPLPVAAITDDPPFTSDFTGAALPLAWTFEDPDTVGASLTVSGSRAHITAPGGTPFDSISSTSSPDNSVGVWAAIPDHGGDIDIAVQVDTDVSDMIEQGLNLICSDGDDAARFAWYHDSSADFESPRHYGYARASGAGGTLGGAIATISDYQSGIPAWLRITYASATGTWTAYDSSDGYTWITRRTGDRAFTATRFKFGFSSDDGASTTGNTIRLNQAVDVIGLGGTDLRDPDIPDRTPVTVTTILGTDMALPTGWVDDSAGTSTATFDGTVLTLAHDLTQDADGGAAGSRLRYTGQYCAEWGIYLRISNPGGNSQAFATVGAGFDNDPEPWIDQYVYSGGYGLEIQSGLIRRPIRIDDTTGRTVDPTAPYSTDLDETPYCHLKRWEDEYDMRDGGIRCFRLERIGRRVRVKEWADGDAEPTTWDLFDGQDQVEDRPLAPTITLSHNGVRTGTAEFDIYELEFYELTPAAAGELAASIPLPAAVVAALVSVPAALGVTALLPAVALEATTVAGAELHVTAPHPVVALTGSLTDPAALAVTVALPNATFTVEVVASAFLAATVPLPVAAFTGDVDSGGALLAAVALLSTAELAAEVADEATLAATAPLPVVAFAGALAAPAALATIAPLPIAGLAGTTGSGEALLAAHVPVPIAALAVRVVVTALLAATVPAPTGGTAGVGPSTPDGHVRPVSRRGPTVRCIARAGATIRSGT